MKTLFRHVGNKNRNRKSSRRSRFARFEALESRQLLAANITGAVYNDLNGDGVHNNGETGLANWTVFLDLDRNASLDAGEPSQLTDADGKYAFRDLTAGDYRVAEVVRAGWTATNPVAGYVDVTVTNEQEKTVNFLDQGSGGTGVITGNVWRDINNNGDKDPEDTGLAGWTLFLDLDGGGTFELDEPFVITDGNGDYMFTGLLGGAGTSPIDYEVTEVVPAGWEPRDKNITAAVFEGQTTPAIDFSNWPDPEKTTSVSGQVFDDENGNGVQDGGEAGLSGWTVFADLNLNNLPDTGEPFGTTDSNGSYSLAGIEAGNVRIAEVQHIDYKPTSPAAGYRNVTLVSGSALSNVDFGNQLRSDAAIGGVIFVDRDKDGVRDPGEEGLPGITVYLDFDNSGSLTAGEPSVVTSVDHFYTPDVDEAGAFHFEKLAGGTYVVRQIVPDELNSPGSDVEHMITVGPSDDIRDLELGDEYRPSEIHGFQYEDVNGNHVRDMGEPGLKNVTIFIDLNRNNVLDADEPTTLTKDDGSYEFLNLEAGAYVVREVIPDGFIQTFPQTKDGILWPAGVSHPAVGNVTPSLIELSLAQGVSHTQTVSLTLPTTGALTNMVDVFLLFDDTGSFTFNSPIVRAAFPEIIAQLQTRLPGINLGFGVGRLEEYGNFADEYSTGRPFVLNQPVIASSAGGYSDAEVLASIQAALDHEAPGYGGDTPETVIEALYQMVTGAGFDGNNDGSLLDSGPAGPMSTQVNPGGSGDVPPFASFTPDPANGVLSASGSIGGAGFRSGALPIIITATDTGFAYQPKGEIEITGVDGLTVPVSDITYAGRGTTPYGSGAGIQETVTGLNALGALVIGLGTNPEATVDPRIGLEALAKLTGSINRTTNTIDNGTADPIAPNDPLYFMIGSGGDPLVKNIADGIVTAIEGAVTAVQVNVTLRASDPRVHISYTPGVINGLGAGDIATFDVTFTGDGRPHRFDLQFIREGTDVVLGSIPVILGTPISGDGYEFEDCEDGEQSKDIDFGSQRIDGVVPNVAPSFTIGANQTVAEDAGTQTVAAWATSINPGSPSESGQVLDFVVSNDNNTLFSVQPTISVDGTLTYTPIADAFGMASVVVQLHDDGGTLNGGFDISAPQTFLIEVTPVNDAPSFIPGPNQTIAQDSPVQSVADWATNISAGPTNESDQAVEFIVSNDMPGLFSIQPAVSDNGILVYMPEPGATGTATVTVQIRDHNGTVNGGVDISEPSTFMITVTPVPVPSATKFFVVDQARRRIFEYDAAGNHLDNSRLGTDDRAPRGIASNPDATRLWVVDKKGGVFVYDNASNLLGSWVMENVGAPEGITVHGDDLWVVDQDQDRIHFFKGGSLLLSGSVQPTSSFQLAAENRVPMDLVTDGVYFWVVDDTRRMDRVFRYQFDGTPDGTWQIDAANAKPTGLTIDPLDVNHIWIVDSSSDAVYQYDGATNQIDGQLAASASFQLARLNSNPQGIADPRGFVTSSDGGARIAVGPAGEDSPPKFQRSDDLFRSEHLAQEKMTDDSLHRREMSRIKDSPRSKTSSSSTIAGITHETRSWKSHLDEIDHVFAQLNDDEVSTILDDFSSKIDTFGRRELASGSWRRM